MKRRVFHPRTRGLACGLRCSRCSPEWTRRKKRQTRHGEDRILPR
jgi:hypothetical protein